MAVDDRSLLCRHHEVGQHLGGGPGWNSDDRLIAGPKHGDVIAEYEPSSAAAGKRNAAQPVSQPNVSLSPTKKADGRIDKGSGESIDRDERPAGPPAKYQGLPQDRGREAGARLGRLGIECCQQQRPPQPVKNRPGAGHGSADGRIRLGEEQPRKSRILRCFRAGNAAAGAQHPPWQATLVREQLPALRAGEVDEIEGNFIRAGKLVLRPDEPEIGQGLSIAGQQQMIAVVDHRVQACVVVGPAAAAGFARRLMKDDFAVAICQPHGRRKACNPRADDMHGHRNRPARSRIPTRCSLPMRTRSRGGSQPRRARRSRIVRYASYMMRGVRTVWRGAFFMIA